MIRMILRGLCAPAVCLALAVPAAAGEPDTPAVILGSGAYWRQVVMRAEPIVSATEARAAGLTPEQARTPIGRRSRRSRILSGRSDPPPADWMKPEFDDSGWDRTRGALSGRHEFGLACRRGKFVVTDPKRVRALTLDLTYCGGVAAYLNGREVLRASLPEGKLEPDTPGGDYVRAAFFVTDGPRKGKLLHSYTDRARKDQFALRPRKAGPVQLPVAALCKGVNVLAVEVHRSGYPLDCRKAGVGQFAPISQGRLFLRADSEPGAVVPAVARRPGFKVWNAEVTEEVTELDYAPAGEPLGPMRIAALRNGRFSGQVVIGSTAPIAGLKATMGPLRMADGAVIPADAVSVRTGRPGRMMTYRGGHVYGGPTGVSMGVHFRRLEVLVETPPATVALSRPGQRLSTQYRRALGLPEKLTAAAVVPVWVTVAVPRDAAAGTYRGTLTLAAAGEKEVAVPVELEVCGWTLPDVQDYISEFSVYQSPDTLAAYYKVPLWSDAHWALIEKSVKLIGEAGNHTLIIPLLSKDQAGNEESFVYWVPKPDGTFTYDTRVMDRYVGLYLKHHPAKRIKAVCLTVWGNAGVASGNPYQKEKYDENGLPKKMRGVFTVTQVDAKTGAKSDLRPPAPGTKEYAAFWRPALLAVRARLRALGLGDRVALGMPADPPIPVPVIKTFHDILPDVGWFVGNHPGKSGYRYDRKDRRKVMPATHVERVYTGPLPDPAVKRQRGWQRSQMCLAFNRYGFGPLCLYPAPSVWAFRMLMEADLASGHRGAGRIGADYWRMGVRSRSGGAGTFYARYPHSSVGQTGMAANCAALLAPGSDGPVTTARFENVREGIQNAEVVIAIETALSAKTVSGALAAKCRRALDERVRAMRTYTLGLGRAGWQQRDRALYRLAAEVAGHLSAER